MYAIKEGISAKFSRLFSDSSSSRTLDHESEARPCAKDGRSMSSILSFILRSRGWFRASSLNNESKSPDSHSFTWKSKSFSSIDKPLDTHMECESEHVHSENTNSNEDNAEHGFDKGVYQSHKSSCCMLENRETGSGSGTSSSSDIFEDAITQHSFDKSISTLMDESLFISPHLLLFFESCLPNLVKGCQWVLLYSTARHGISLHTLIRNSATVSGPCLLITSDKQGAVFGGLLECPLMSTAKRKYQGTNQTFVFTTVYGEPRPFRPTGCLEPVDRVKPLATHAWLMTTSLK